MAEPEPSEQAAPVAATEETVAPVVDSTEAPAESTPADEPNVCDMLKSQGRP